MAGGILARGDGASIVYDSIDGHGPTIVFLHGLKSDRSGSKALALEAYCRDRGQAFVRFDMFGHGQSSGAFTDGTVGRWAEDSLAVIDELTSGKVILVGSSMGGWVMLLAALARPDRVAGLVGIAPAPDATEDLMWRRMPAAMQEDWRRTGMFERPSAYGDEPYRLSYRLVEDGRKHLLLDRPIPITCPVRLIHGQKDADVPWETSMRLAERIDGADVEVILVKSGDHRLSVPADLDRLTRVVGALLDA